MELRRTFAGRAVSVGGTYHPATPPRRPMEYLSIMVRSSTFELVLLTGGRADDPSAEDSPARGDLRVVRGTPGDLQAAAAARIAETVDAARRVRQEIEARIAAALDGLLHVRAPEPAPR